MDQTPAEYPLGCAKKAKETPMKQVIYILALALGLSGPAWALDKERFSQERFESLKAGGELVLVGVWAKWCGTCARQQQLIQEYLDSHPEMKLNILLVDYDEDTEWVRQFAPRQSTLLLFLGEDLFWYAVAEFRKDVIFDAFDAALVAAQEESGL